MWYNATWQTESITTFKFDNKEKIGLINITNWNITLGEKVEDYLKDPWI